MLCDPMISWGVSHQGVSRWSETGIPDPHNVLGQASDFGLNYGVVVSCGPMSLRSIGGFSRSDREFTDDEMARVLQLVNLMHDKTERPTRLTNAQI